MDVPGRSGMALAASTLDAMTPLPRAPGGSLRVADGVAFLEDDEGSGSVFLWGMAAWSWCAEDRVARRLAALASTSCTAATSRAPRSPPGTPARTPRRPPGKPLHRRLEATRPGHEEAVSSHPVCSRPAPSPTSPEHPLLQRDCLLYTSDAADDL